jgi:hypothetical protein
VKMTISYFHAGTASPSSREIIAPTIEPLRSHTRKLSRRRPRGRIVFAADNEALAQKGRILAGKNHGNVHNRRTSRRI